MSEEKKLKPMSDHHFKGMVWTFRLLDVFLDPRRHLKKIPLKEGMVVVDYGCGPGRYTVPIAELVGTKGRVFAVDIQPLAIKTVKEKAARKSLKNIEAVLVDSFNTGIQSSSTDVVLAIDMIHSITDYDALFHEIHRILKPNGLLFMDTGHMQAEKAREIVVGSGLFAVTERRGRDMLLTKRLNKEAKKK
jgi:ubiquinone/menaquinone biosynthesis C-methylase UbiE